MPGRRSTSPTKLRELLWERDVVSMLVSATLEPRFLRGRLGLDEAREVSLPSPYDYREQALLYVPRSVPRAPLGGLRRAARR